jgi:Cof subfamily protein (haloacid dehalogenase superfamily)
MTLLTTKLPTIRAMFLDIDGTLITGNECISDNVKRSLYLAKQKGVEVVLCTGRTRYRLIPIAEQMPEPAGYAVCSNGGVATHLGTGEILYRHLMPKTVALQVIRAIVDAGSEPYVFEDSDRMGIEGARVLFHPDLPVGHWADLPRYRPHEAILEELPFEPVSVSAFGHPDAMRPLAARLMRELSGAVAVIQSGSNTTWGVEVYVAKVDKLLGMQTIASRIGVNRDEILAIGDHVNDMEMLKWAGVGVAMGNALPEIIAAADWVTAAVTRDGVARAIERYILLD